MGPNMADLLIFILGATAVGLVWLVVNIKAGSNFLKFISLFSLLVCLGMALAALIKLAVQVLGG